MSDDLAIEIVKLIRRMRREKQCDEWTFISARWLFEHKRFTNTSAPEFKATLYYARRGGCRRFEVHWENDGMTLNDMSVRLTEANRFNRNGK